jgi:hypothetical protein
MSGPDFSLDEVMVEEVEVMTTATAQWREDIELLRAWIDANTLCTSKCNMEQLWLYITKEGNYDEWEALRRDRLSGSGIPKALGVSSYQQTKSSYFKEFMRGSIGTNYTAGWYQQELMQKGNEMEPQILLTFKKVLQLTRVFQAGYVVNYLLGNDGKTLYPIINSPDVLYWTEEEGKGMCLHGAEIKYTSRVKVTAHCGAFIEKELELAPFVPPIDWLIQMHSYMVACKKTQWELWVMTHDKNWGRWEIVFSQEMWNVIWPLLVSFVENATEARALLPFKTDQQLAELYPDFLSRNKTRSKLTHTLLEAWKNTARTQWTARYKKEEIPRDLMPQDQPRYRTKAERSSASDTEDMSRSQQEDTRPSGAKRARKLVKEERCTTQSAPSVTKP